MIRSLTSPYRLYRSRKSVPLILQSDPSLWIAALQIRSGLELHAQFQLKHARQICLRGNLAKARAGNVRIDATKPYSVEYVEGIDAKCELQLFIHPKIARQAQILIHEVRISQTIGAGCRSIAVRK